MGKLIRIGTRDSQLALWQANEVKGLLEAGGYEAELVPVKSEGDLDLVTPLYELGVQGVFTRTLDAALLGGRVDVVVHSMKDVPVQLAQGLAQAAALPRASYKDILVFKGGWSAVQGELGYRDGAWLQVMPSATGTLAEAVIATSSVRRRAQWLHRYPHHRIENLRGNVNTRLQKLSDSNWLGAIFAAAGLDRIGLRPEHSIELDWMLPAPAQGAIMVAARAGDDYAMEACAGFNDAGTALCTRIERSFLRALLGGCSTPISALATIEGEEVVFRGNIVTPDGSALADLSKRVHVSAAGDLGAEAAEELLARGGAAIAAQVRNAQS